MSKRRRKRKPRGPGVYQNPDGSTTTITQHGDEILEVTTRKAPGRPAVTMTTKSTGIPSGQRTNGLTQAPTIRTNVIPGEKPGVIFDQGTGLTFNTRSELDKHYKEHNLVDMSGREAALRHQAPSYESEPKRSGSQFVQAFDPKNGLPPATISDKTIMTPETRQRVFGGASGPKIGRRFK